MRRASAFVLALPLAGCAVGPNYLPPAATELAIPATYATAAAPGERPDLGRWWTLLGDPVLNSIIDRAQAGNLDLAQAAARLRQAREALVQARGALLPSVSASAGAGRNFVSNGIPDSTSLSLGGDASYTVDLFGGVRRSIESARGAAQATGYDLATVRLSIEAEVARNYIAARVAQANLANARDSLALQDDNLQIAGFRVQAGLVSSLDVEQARTQRAQTAAQVPAIEQSYAAAVNRLGVLTGQAPGALGAELAAAAPIPAGPAALAAGIPADTLRQRPDVRAAERRLAAATAQIGVAEAALYPQLGISGNIATAATSFGGLANTITGGLFAGLSQLIFDAGRTRSRVRAQQAAAEGALALYRQTVLTALEDVENGLTALSTANERRAAYAEQLDAANNYAILARSQYRAGLTDFTTLNAAEASLLSARTGLSSATGDQATALVQLATALGGGWDAASIPENAGN